MPRKSYGDVKRQISALIAEQRTFEEKAINALTKAVMATDAGDQLAALSNAELQAVAKKVAAGMGDVINQVKAERIAKAVKKARAANTEPEQPAGPTAPTSESEPPAQPVRSKILQPPVAAPSQQSASKPHLNGLGYRA